MSVVSHSAVAGSRGKAAKIALAVHAQIKTPLVVSRCDADAENRIVCGIAIKGNSILILAYIKIVGSVLILSVGIAEAAVVSVVLAHSVIRHLTRGGVGICAHNYVTRPRNYLIRAVNLHILSFHNLSFLCENCSRQRTENHYYAQKHS